MSVMYSARKYGGIVFDVLLSVFFCWRSSVGVLLSVFITTFIGEHYPLTFKFMG
jgi:hypothetical protein